MKNGFFLAAITCRCSNAQNWPAPTCRRHIEKFVGMVIHVCLDIDKTLETMENAMYTTLHQRFIFPKQYRRTNATFHAKRKARDHGLRCGPIYMRSKEEIDQAPNMPNA